MPVLARLEQSRGPKVTAPLPRVAIVDAFTRTPGLGNRAGVVAGAAGLNEAAMRSIARAVAASETAFVLSVAGGADIRLRYFSPAAEVDFCGHATVATFHRLAEVGALSAPGRHTLVCNAGRLEVELEPADPGWRIWIETPRHPWTESPFDRPTLMALLGGEEKMLEKSLPVRRSGPKIFVPLATRRDVWSLAPRWEEMEREGLRHGLWGFFIFSRETLEPGHVAHGRFFAPGKGVREDPVTGAANGPLGEYLVLNDVIPLPLSGGTARARAEQGDVMNKPGRIELEVNGAPGRIERTRIGGVAVTVMDALLLPAPAVVTPIPMSAR
jgi:trans-2,3-dihydro-3-hydroxyanthranilate isomerase